MIGGMESDNPQVTALAIPDHLPDGFAEATILPALWSEDHDPEYLLDLDAALMAEARKREGSDDQQEWKRCVALVRRRIGEAIEPMTAGRPKLLDASNNLDGAGRVVRAEYRVVADPPRTNARWST